MASAAAKVRVHAGTELSELPVKSIQPSKTNPRRFVRDGEFTDLVESIRQHGVIQAVLVRPLAKGGFELVCGHRRLAAATAAGLDVIPATVRELDDQKVLAVQLVENLKRTDLTVLDEAEGYVQLMKIMKRPVDEIAREVGVSVKYIYDRVKLLELAGPAEKLLRENRITAGHAILLARLSAKDQVRAIGEPEKNRGYRSGQHSGGLFRGAEHGLFDDAKVVQYELCSVREFGAWIDDNIKFRPKVDAHPLLFPATHAALTQEKKELAGPAAAKDTWWIPITYDYVVPPDAKDGERVFTERAWKRADGKEKSKTCDHSRLGVVVIGDHRGEAFDVCVAKEKCTVHYGSEIRERAKRAKAGAGHKSKSAAAAAKAQARRDASWEYAQRKRDQETKAWETARPAMLELVAAAVLKASASSKGKLAQVLLDAVDAPARAGVAAVPIGRTADDLVRHLAFRALARKSGDIHWGRPKFVKQAKALGVDVNKLYNAELAKARAAEKSAAKKDGKS